MTEATAAAADGNANAGTEAAAAPTGGQATASATTVAVDAGKPAVAGQESKPATVAAGTETDGKNVAQFPANWREEMAGGDEDILKVLQRYTDPKQAGKALREQQKALSSRKPEIQKPGKDATEEQIAEFRKASGLPLSADDYIKNLSMPDGRSIGEEDKKLVSDFAKEVGLSTEAGLSQAQFDKAISWYYRTQQAQMDQIATEDHNNRVLTEDALRQEFGADFRANINAIGTLFDGAPKGLKDRLLSGRMADGRRLGDDKDMVVFLSRLARDLNPAATITPANGQTPGATVDSRIAEIEKTMANNPDAYWKDSAMRGEYTKLLQVREQSRKRG